MTLPRRLTPWPTAITCLALAAAASADPVVSHEVRVRLDPGRHLLAAADRLVAPAELWAGGGLHLRLRGELELSQVLRDGVAIEAEPCTEHAVAGKAGARPPLRCWVLRGAAGQAHELAIEVRGEIYDPPRQDETLRFVVGEKTAGTIAPEGVYLPGGPPWVPTPAGDVRQRFDVEIATPTGWQGVGQGTCTRSEEVPGGHVNRWENAVPCDGLSIVAGPYVAATRRWNGIALATYLFAEDQALSNAYLDAAQKFLAFYDDLLVPYPYGQFSIVENFFATGYGMPGYTLLGKDVVKMAGRYTGAVGLGHEILHSWWGNYVFADETEGNWCEGLTTYCANYLYSEKTDGEEKAKEYRRHAMTRFSVLVPPGKDYPVRRFGGKTTEIDNEVGYTKGSMIFHLLRRKLGDEKFFAALRAVLKENGGRRATWETFQKAFEAALGEPLDAFFRQWLDRTGAPVLGRLEVSRMKGQAQDGKPSQSVYISLEQLPEMSANPTLGPDRLFHAPDEHADPWYVEVPIRFRTSTHVEDAVLKMFGTQGKLALALPSDARLLSVEADPDYHLFRRLDVGEIPPCLNLTLNAENKTLVLPVAGDRALVAAYQPIIARLREQPGWTIVEPRNIGIMHAGTRLLLGGPRENPEVDSILSSMNEKYHRFPDDERRGPIRSTGSGVVLDGLECSTPDSAALFTIPNESGDGTITIFYGLSPKALERPARLLVYYGWESYYAFQDGQVVKRGNLDVAKNPLRMEFTGR